MRQSAPSNICHFPSGKSRSAFSAHQTHVSWPPSSPLAQPTATVPAWASPPPCRCRARPFSSTRGHSGPAAKHKTEPPAPRDQQYCQEKCQNLCQVGRPPLRMVPYPRAAARPAIRPSLPRRCCVCWCAPCRLLRPQNTHTHTPRGSRHPTNHPSSSSSPRPTAAAAAAAAAGSTVVPSTPHDSNCLAGTVIIVMKRH